MAGEKMSHSESQKPISRAERRSAHAEAARPADVAKKIAEREARQEAQKAEDTKKISALRDMVSHKGGSDLTSSTEARPLGSRKDISKLSIAMEASHKSGAKDIVHSMEKKSFWSRAKESLFGPSAETIAQLKAELESLPDATARESSQTSRTTSEKGLRDTTRSTGGSSLTSSVESSPLGGRKEIGNLGTAMEASRKSGAKDIVDKDAFRDQKSWWSRAKESFFGPSKEQLALLRSEKSPTVPKGESDEARSRAENKKMHRAERSVSTSSFSSESKRVPLSVGFNKNIERAPVQAANNNEQEDQEEMKKAA